MSDADSIALTGTSLAEFAKLVSVSADHQSKAGEVAFTATVDDLPVDLLGARLRLMLGSRTVMTIQVPTTPQSAPLTFGPTKLPMALLRRMDTFGLNIRLDEPRSNLFEVSRHSGSVLEAANLTSSDKYFEKIQLHGSRYKDPDLLTIGARAAFSNFKEFQLRASALTIQAHRILDKDYAALSDEDWSVIDELLALADPIVAEGQSLIDGAPKPAWDVVRWTVSLATVAGNLAIMRDDLKRAARFFGAAAANVGHVAISHVSALNVINGCFFSGILEAMLGNRDKAAETLLEGIVRFKDAVAPQNLLANVWVIGDLINVAMASRQCFIARVRLGLWEKDASALIDPGSVPILVGLKSPLARIVEAGLAPTFATEFAKMGRVTG